MKTFIGTKILAAAAMTLGDYNALRGWTMPADEDPQAPGYLVEYQDGGKANHPDYAGYISWSPAGVFEFTYQTDGGMSFGHAVAMLKQGKKVARSGWNGKGMFAYYVPAASYPVQTGAAKSHFGEGALVPYNHYLALKGADGTVSTWAPSGSDALADDWMVVD